MMQDNPKREADDEIAPHTIGYMFDLLFLLEY